MDKCPQQPRIPTYLLVGGWIFGVNMLHLLWRTRFIQKLKQEDEFLDFMKKKNRTHMNTSESEKLFRILDSVLTLSGIVWFILGNFWILSIWSEVNFQRPVMQPNNFCHWFLFLFALVQILSIHILAGFLFFISATMFVTYVVVKNTQ